MEKKNEVEEFCNNYNISSEMVIGYLRSMKIGDIPSIDTYKLIMENECPQNLLEEMREDLKELVKNSS